jgi:hypothetical protein
LNFPFIPTTASSSYNALLGSYLPQLFRLRNGEMSSDGDFDIWSCAKPFELDIHDMNLHDSDIQTAGGSTLAQWMQPHFDH